MKNIIIILSISLICHPYICHSLGCYNCVTRNKWVLGSYAGLALNYPPGFYPSRFIWINPPNFIYIYPEKNWKLDLQSAGSSPNLTYTEINALDAIRGWIWTPPLDSDLETSHIFPKVLGLRVEELGTPHWHLMVLGYSPSKTEGWFITFFLNL